MGPDSLASPIRAATSSFACFSVGALIPLLPWFFGAGTAATITSLVLAVAAAVVVGWVIAATAERPVARVVVRQLLFTLVPAAITYAVGSALGVSGVT